MAPRPPRRKGKSPRKDATVSGLKGRVDGVKQLRAAAERMGAEDSVGLLDQVLLDLDRLEQFERAKHGAGGGHGGGSRFTPAICARFLQAITVDGMFLEHAADRVGISRNTMHRWLREGFHEPEGKYGQFYRDVTAARTEQTHALVTRAVQLAKNGDGHLLRWLLERRDPQVFLLANRVEVTGPEGGPLQVDVTKLSDDELQRIAAGLAAASGGGAGTTPPGPRS